MIIYPVSVLIFVSHAAESLALNLHGECSAGLFFWWRTGCIFAFGRHNNFQDPFNEKWRAGRVLSENALFLAHTQCLIHLPMTVAD